MNTILNEFIEEIGDLPEKFTTTLCATPLTDNQKNSILASLLEVRELLTKATLKMKQIDNELLTQVRNPTLQDTIRLAEYAREKEYFDSVVYPLTVAKLIANAQNERDCTDFCCS